MSTHFDGRTDALASARDASHMVCDSISAALDLPEPLDSRWPVLIERSIAQYGIAYLLLVLHRVDPARADWASAQLLTAWQAGDSLTEWAGQWAREIDAGQQPTIPLWDQQPTDAPTIPEYSDVRAYKLDDVAGPGQWFVSAGDYADDPDLLIHIDHAVDSEGYDQRPAVAAHLVRALVGGDRT